MTNELSVEEAIKLLKSKMDGHTDTSYEWVETVRMAIKALEQTRWIPVSERLPEERNYYLVTIEIDGIGCKPCYGLQISWYSDKQFVVEYIGDGLVAKRSVIAWMPLPQPYKAESEE